MRYPASVDLRRLEYFLAVLDHGSLTRAASALGVPQPSISEGLHVLERELRTPLFFRVGRGMSPTAAGAALAPHARQALRDLAGAHDAVTDLDADTTRHLAILVQANFMYPPVTNAVADLRRRHPRVSVVIQDFADRHRVQSLISEGQFDLAVGHLPLTAPGLQTWRFGSHGVYIAFPPSRRDLHEGAYTLEELRGERIVSVTSGAVGADRIQTAVEQALLDRGVEHTVSAVVANHALVIPSVLFGLGCAFVATPAARNAAARGAEVRPLDLDLTFDYGAVARQTPSRLALEFVNLAQAGQQIVSEGAHVH